MICSLSCVFFIFALQVPAFAQQKSTPLSEVREILFLGNSITYSGEYLAYVETVYRLNHPENRSEWLNLGLPSETVSGLSEEGHAGGAFPRPDLHERLDRVFGLIDPDLVFVNYGMNDGIYLPFDSARFEKYAEGLNWLDQKVQATGAQAVFITPPVYDPVKGTAYSETLDHYSTWLIRQSEQAGWQVIDTHFPMKSYLDQKRKSDPDFYLAKDGVHPGPQGHWLIARPILAFLQIEIAPDQDSFEEYLEKYRWGAETFELVRQKQKILRDAYLSAAGHLRPGIAEGLPLAEAKKQAALLENQIWALLVSIENSH